MSINRLLLEKIKEKRLDQNLVTTLIEVLHLSQSQTYRRVNETVEFSLSEAATLITTFNIAPDEIFLEEKKENSINFKATLGINNSYFDFLQNLRDVMQTVERLPKVDVQHTSNEFPTFLHVSLSQSGKI